MALPFHRRSSQQQLRRLLKSLVARAGKAEASRFKRFLRGVIFKMGFQCPHFLPFEEKWFFQSLHPPQETPRPEPTALRSPLLWGTSHVCRLQQELIPSVLLCHWALTVKKQSQFKRELCGQQKSTQTIFQFLMRFPIKITIKARVTLTVRKMTYLITEITRLLNTTLRPTVRKANDANPQSLSWCPHVTARLSGLLLNQHPRRLARA